MPEETRIPPDDERTVGDGRAAVADKDLEVYRSLLETPKTFENGFTWTAVAGAFFCGLLMMPGSIYLSLITGGTISAAWVTLIIFSEVSRRAMKTLKAQELVVLLYVANAMSVGGPIAALIWRQYFISSDAVRDAGLIGQFPTWWAPQPGSLAVVQRNLFSQEWLVPILLIIFVAVVGRIMSYTLAYFFFRLTSDVERLPFPLAPIGAQGAMALAESGEKETTWKWKVFSTGAMLGLGFAFVQIGIPLVSGAILSKPIQIIPLPWYDSTTLTEGFMPATPTGVAWDLGLVLMGMVIPFWAVMGQGAAVILTAVLNPVLHHAGVLTRWQPGMDTISTTFSNSVDFWMAFGLGVAGGVAIISVFQTVRELSKKLKEMRRTRAQSTAIGLPRTNIWAAPPGRGDFSPWLALAIYFGCAALTILLCHALVPKFPIIFLFIFSFVYTPFISYINTRIAGICGASVDIPFVREAGIILSGYKGVEIWLAPIIVDNYGATGPTNNVGGQAQSFRVTELTGTNFWSYVKADCLIVPLSFVLSFIFWAFIWHASAIPGDQFPFAQKMWDLNAKQAVLLYSSTLDTGGAKPMFYQALNPANVPGGGLTVIGGALLFTIVAFAGLSTVGLPIMAVYGFIQAIGGMPHFFIPMIFGAFIGRFYFQKRFGQQRFLQMAPVLVAGYGTGVGLIALIGVAVNLIIKAISASPF